MDELEDRKVRSREKEELEKTVEDAIDEASKYGFYYMVANDILPKIFKSDSFKKIVALKEQHQGERRGIKDKVEHDILKTFGELKQELQPVYTRDIADKISMIDQQIAKRIATRIGWKHVYDKIQDLLKYLLSFPDTNHISLKYAKVSQQKSSVEFVIDSLKNVPAWKKMQQIECMFTSDCVTDVCVAAILLDGLLKSWNAAKNKQNIFDLDIDADLQLFLVSMQQDYEEFVLLGNEGSKYQGNLSFFTKAKILSCLDLVINKMFAEELVLSIGISPRDCFVIIVQNIGSQPCLLLEMTSIKQATTVVYILKKFKGGASSKIYKLTNYIFGSKNEIVINIGDACVKYKLKELSWSEYIFKINFQFFQDIIFREHDDKNCMQFLKLEFSGKDLSPDQRKKLGSFLEGLLTLT